MSPSPTAPGDMEMRSKFVAACTWPVSKLLIRSCDGCATKSFAAICIEARAILNSRLASEIADADSALSRALVSSFCPAGNEIALARDPNTGVSAIPTMRVRTDTDEMSLASRCFMIGVLFRLGGLEEARPATAVASTDADP